MKKRIVILIIVMIIFLSLGFLLAKFIIPKISKNSNDEVINTNIVENSVTEPVIENSEDNWKNKVKQVINEYQDTENVVYTLCDIEKDNIPELIIRTGSSEAEYLYKFYRYINENVELIGEMGAGHTLIYEMNNENYIMPVYAHMDYEIVYHIYIENDKFVLNEVSQREIGVGEEYIKGDKNLELYSITDMSLLESYNSK